MSDRKTSSTPIIVGAVIAILGILTGLYVATNAREQMQAQDPAESQASAAATGETDATSANADITSMPDLPAVDYTPGRVPDEAVAESESEPDSESASEPTTEVEEKPETTTDETLPYVPDDFEPVSTEEIEQALPKKDHPEETHPTQE